MTGSKGLVKLKYSAQQVPERGWQTDRSGSGAGAVQVPTSPLFPNSAIIAKPRLSPLTFANLVYAPKPPPGEGRRGGFALTARHNNGHHRGRKDRKKEPPSVVCKGVEPSVLKERLVFGESGIRSAGWFYFHSHESSLKHLIKLEILFHFAPAIVLGYCNGPEWN